ncbi:MAG: arylsulfatase [Opitutae bacterium]|nr:arylsulfatase [Opitutae bacterium]
MTGFNLLRLAALGLVGALSAPAANPPAFAHDYRAAAVNWPAPVRPPAGAPHVVVILWDDIGFAQFGCYGSPIATPNVDRLAAAGVRYSNFHVAPVCSPTRAALLTGRNPHSVGVACIAEYASAQANSTGGIRPDAGTMAEYLRAGGYSTFAVGKWHLTPMTELNPAASSAYWPTGRGFDHFYGFSSGETNPWNPELYQDRERLKNVPAQLHGRPYHSETDLTDHAIGYIAEHRANQPDKPFFLYLAYSAGHAPHHAPPEYLAKWRGKFDAGWDALRATTLARQKALGLVPADAALPPANPGIKPWAELTPEQQRVYARYYETFAAFVEHTDHEMGRLLDYLEHAGLKDHTLIILASDNGASPEGGPDGQWNEIRLFTTGTNGTLEGGAKHLDDLGNALTYPTYPTGWTQAGNTPFRRAKGTTHEGGVRVPLIMRWPGHIPATGEVRPQFHDVVDVLPTVLEATGVKPAAAGPALLPLHGTSMAYTWKDAAAPSRRATQYVEIYGHRAIYHEGWKAVTFHPPDAPFEQDKWELYDLANDFNERHDLAAARPDRLAALLAAWEREAQANGVYPLDDRRAAREMLLPPGSPQQGARFEFFPPVSGIHKGVAPDLRGRSWSMTADIAPGDAARAGVLLAFGGRFAGYALYVHEGRLKFHYNYAGEERTTVATADPVPTAARQLGASFTLTPDGGADVFLSVDGREAGRGHVPRRLHNITHETLDLGCDLYTPVSADYASPAAFTGALRKVTLEAAPR